MTIFPQGKCALLSFLYDVLWFCSKAKFRAAARKTKLASLKIKDFQAFFTFLNSFSFYVFQNKKTLQVKLQGQHGGGGWIRTTEAEATDLQSAPFGHSGTPPYEIVELVDGLEPPTC